MNNRTTCLRLLFCFALLPALALSGCAHRAFSDRLSEYEAQRELPFSARTLAWTAQAAAGELAAPAPASPPPVALADAATSPSEPVREQVLASVLEISPARLDALRQTIASPAARDAALADRLEWPELALAVAVASPAAHAAEERWRATLRQFSQAEHLESLINQYRSFTATLETGAGDPLNRAMTDAFFPYPSTLAFKGEMIREEARMARLEWELALRAALIEAGQAFFQFQYLHRAEATTRENLSLVGDLLAVIEQRYAAGQAGQADLLRMQTLRERLKNELRDLQSRQRVARAEINALLGRGPEAALGTPASRDLPLNDVGLAELARAALDQRQEVKLAESRAALRAIAIRMGEIMNRPPASQGASLFEPWMPAAEAAARPAPRPAFAQAEAYLAELRGRLAADEAESAQARATARARAAAWLEEREIARRAAALLREIVLPQNRSTYEASLSAYSAAELTFVELLDAERALLDARLELDAARRELNQVLIRRAEVTGRVPVGD